MRALLAFLGRTVLALVVLGVAGAVVVAGVQNPPPDTRAVPPASVAVPAAPTVLVCPGPLRLPTELQPGDDAAYDPQFDTAPAVSDLQIAAATARAGDAAAADATLTLLASGAPVGQVVAGGGNGITRVRQPLGPVVVRADAVDGVPAWAAGTLHVRTASGDLAGMVTAPCQRPSAQSWLVGGSTRIGSSARLVLQNAGLTAATVTVRMWGASGPVEPAGATDYLVPPASERVVLLEGVAAEQDRIVVQTAAVGGLVTAYLQDSRLNGLVPAGVDDVVAGAGPATLQVVTGVALTETDDPEAAVLRVLAPGDEGGDVSVTLLGPDGAVPLPGGTATLTAGTVLDIPLDGVAAGDYTAVVSADVPVVAGAMLSRSSAGAEGAADRAWVASASAGPAAMAIPDGATARLVLASVPDSATKGRSPVVIEADGRSSEQIVEEGSTVTLPLSRFAADVGSLVVRTDDPRVVWAVVLEDADMISVLVPVAPLDAQPRVGVTVR